MGAGRFPVKSCHLLTCVRMVHRFPAGLSEVSEGLGLLFQPQSPRGAYIKQHPRQKNVSKPKPAPQNSEVSPEKQNKQKL